jgi:hypothetical protein
MNARQAIKALVWFSLASTACYSALWISAGRASVVFEEILSAFLVVIMLLVPASVALFTYIEGISKELTELRNEVSRQKLETVMGKMSDLKREVISNAILIAGLCLAERSIKGLAVFSASEVHGDHCIDLQWTALAIRFGFFVLSLVSAGSQMSGFLVAISFRDEISKNRK